MTKYELNERFADMYRKSREDAGKSQEYMARAIGVSKKTIQNWEDGTSSPNQIKSFEWFEVLNLQPLPYYLDVFYPGRFDTNASDEDVTESIIGLIKALPSDSRKKLLYMLAGNHGSSTIGILELITANLHTPLDKRINVAMTVATNYELSQYQDVLVCKDQIQPNMETLISSIELGKRAVIKGKPSATIDISKGENL